MVQQAIDIAALPEVRGTVHILLSKWYPDLVRSLCQKCTEVLEAKGVRYVTHRLPGTLEFGFAAQHLCRLDPAPDAIICLGVVVKGDTFHFEMIVNEAGRALGAVSRDTGIPIINEVLPVRCLAEANARCGDDEFNKGIEAAAAAIEIIHWQKENSPL